MAVERRPEIDFAALRADEALIVSTVQRVFPALRRMGNVYRVPVGEDGDSLSVYSLDGVWRYKRFSDQSDRGDVLDFVRRYFGAASLSQAADMLGRLPVPVAVRRVAERRQQQAAEPKETPGWMLNPEPWLRRYEEHPKRYKLWRAYKPLLRATVDRWRFGVGVLPHRVDRSTGERLYPMGCDHERLVYPVFVDGRCVAVRGRSIDCRCPKWISAYGSEAALWGSDLLLPDSRPGALFVPESPIDAALAMQVRPDVLAVASTAGCSTWRDEWSARVAAARPASAVVVYDHDLAGACRPDHCPSCTKAFNDWRARILARQLDRGLTPSEPRPPSPAAPKVRDSLRAAGVRDVDAFDWPAPFDAAPYHADLGYLIAVWMGQPAEVASLAAT